MTMPEMHPSEATDAMREQARGHPGGYVYMVDTAGLNLPCPTNDLERALRFAATGHLPEPELLAVLVSSKGFVFAGESEQEGSSSRNSRMAGPRCKPSRRKAHSRKVVRTGRRWRSGSSRRRSRAARPVR